MTGNESIDFSLENIWQSWFSFRKGKQSTPELERFQYYLEQNLSELAADLQNNTYRHGTYRTFIVCDNKKRQIAVAPIKDRIVHRLLYNYLLPIWDQTFIYDAWSCRMGKGLSGTIERTQEFLKSYPDAYIWKGDIRKFFDNVDQMVLLDLLKRRVRDKKALVVILEVLGSYGKKVGMPIGNLTSQIFANIYLNELDRFVKHKMKPLAYLRYGDDFILLATNKKNLENMRKETKEFISTKLKLELNPKCDLILKVRYGLKFLGLNFWSSARKLSERNQKRIKNRLNLSNLASYRGIISKYGGVKLTAWFHWRVQELIFLL